MSTSEKVVVVGVDFGSSGDAAILLGLEQLVSGGASVLHFMHVIDPRDVIDYPERRALETEEEVLAQAPLILRERIKELSTLVSGEIPKERLKTHARLGKAVETLLQTCVDYDADLLIVGTHGRKGLDRVLLGSVAESLVRSGRCPVLVARAKSYVGLEKTKLPDPPYASGEAPQRRSEAGDVEHVTSTESGNWHPSDSGPTGFRIV